MGVPEQQVEANPEHRVEEAPEQQAEEAPEQQKEQRTTLEETRTPPYGTEVDPTVASRGSGRHRRFKKLHWQTKR